MIPIKLLLLTFGSILLAILVGAIGLKYLFHKKPNLFESFAAGLGVIVTLTALVSTSFKSVMLGNMILLCVTAYLYRQKETNPNSAQLGLILFKKEYFIHFVVFCSVFFVQYAGAFNIYSGQAALLPHIDFQFYARIVDAFSQQHPESALLDPYLQIRNAPNAYHFFEIWLAAFASVFLSINSTAALYVFAYSIINFAVYIGAYQLAKTILPKIPYFPFIIGSLSALILVIASFDFIYPQSISSIESILITTPLLSRFKLGVIYILFLLGSIEFFKSNYKSLLIIFPLLVVNYTVTLPVSLLCIATLIAILLYKNKVTLIEAIYLNIPVLYVLVFYAFYSDIHNGANPIGAQLEALPFLTYIKTSINILGKSVIQILITMLPVFVAAYFLIKKEGLQFRIYLLTFSAISIASLMAWVIFHPIFDSIQFWTNTYNVSASIFTFVTILMLLKHWKSSNTIKTIFLCLIIGVLYQASIDIKIDTNRPVLDIHCSKCNFNPKEPISIGYFASSDFYLNRLYKVEMFQVGGIQSLFRKFDKIKVICLNPENIPIESEVEKIVQGSFTLNYYAKQVENTQEGITSWQIKTQFCQDYNLQYVLVDNRIDFPTELNQYFNKIPCGTTDGYNVHPRLNPI